jgi:hypothetical protein
MATSTIQEFSDICNAISGIVEAFKGEIPSELTIELWNNNLIEIGEHE